MTSAIAADVANMVAIICLLVGLAILLQMWRKKKDTRSFQRRSSSHKLCVHFSFNYSTQNNRQVTIARPRQQRRTMMMTMTSNLVHWTPCHFPNLQNRHTPPPLLHPWPEAINPKIKTKLLFLRIKSTSNYYYTYLDTVTAFFYFPRCGKEQIENI